jgi:hypothetical protein
MSGDEKRANTRFAPCRFSLCSIFLDGRFIGQHNRDAVPNGVYATALDAFKTVAVGSRLHLFFAERAGEDFEKFFVYCHIFSYPVSRTVLV